MKLLSLEPESSASANSAIPAKKENGGRGWIRTIEVCDGRFTVCSLWPLGNLSIAAADKRRWSRRWDLNPQPADYKSAALPIELRRLIWTAQKPLFQSQLTICVAVFYYGFDMAAQLSYHMDRRNARTFLKFTDKNILYHRAWRHIFSPHRYKPAHFPSAYHKDNRSQWRL